MSANKQEEENKVVCLYQFIRELNKLKQKIVVNVSEYGSCLPIALFPVDPENIHVYARDRVETDEAEESSNVLLSVHKPEFQPCPKPNAIFADCWLLDGWDSYRKPASVHKFLELPKSEEDAELSEEENREYFEDDPARVKAYQAWCEQRNTWVHEQEICAKTRELFTDLYHVITALRREPETLEFIVADGFICDTENPDINHPVLTRRVNIRLEAEENTIYIDDSIAIQRITAHSHMNETNQCNRIGE